MIEFVQEYWLGAVFAGITSGLTLAVRQLFKRAKAEREEQRLLKAGMLAMLHDRIYKECQKYLQAGYCTVEDRDNLEYLFRPYAALGGNGTGEDLYKKAKALPYTKKEARANEKD